MELANKFLKFLKSEDKVLYIENQTEAMTRYFYFSKMPYNNSIDMLFMTCTYYDKIQTNDTLEYCGFYDKINDTLYDISYKLRNQVLELKWDNNTYKDMKSLQEEYNEKVSEIITNYVLDNPKEFYDAAENYQSDIVKRDVYQYIMDNEFQLKYKCNYYNCNKSDIFYYLDQGEDYLYNKAFQIIEKDKECIGKKLIYIDKTNDIIKEINKDKKDSIHKKKEIVDVIKNGDYSNVHVFINKNGIDFDFKYSASILKKYWNYSYLNTYNMPLTDRKNFERLFGYSEDFHYEEIYKLEYRGKIIYEDKNFCLKREKQEDELTL